MRPRKLAVAVAAVVEAVVVVTIAGPCGAEQLHDAAAAAGGGYKAVQLRDPEDEAESLEAEVKVCRVSVVAGGSDVVERMMESRRRLQNGVRARLLSWWMRWMPASSSVRRTSGRGRSAAMLNG